jgi:hypothetical protein
MHLTKNLLSSSLILLASISSSAMAQSDDLLRNLFQNLQNYLGVSQIDNREYENRLRAVQPPYADRTMVSGNYLLAAEDTQGMKDLEAFLTGRAINWNMLQPENGIGNEALVTQHLLGFCSDEEAKARICERGVTVEQGGAADLLVGTLLNNDTLNEQDQLAVWAFTDNILNPIPLALLEETFEGEDFTSDALPTLEGSPMREHYDSVKIRPLTSSGISSLAGRYKQMAFLSTAQHAFNQIAADRHIVRGLGDKVGMSEPDASIFAALKFESNYRYGDANWHKMMNSGTTESLLRELANMMAFQLTLDFKRYEQEQILTTLMATQIAYYAQSMGMTENALQNSQF